MVTISALSTRYIRVPVLPDPLGGVPYNPTGDAVAMAFMPRPADVDPAPGDWKAGLWEVPAAGVYLAQVLVGPANGGVVLPAGDYRIWLKITDNPEVPVEVVGILAINP